MGTCALSQTHKTIKDGEVFAVSDHSGNVEVVRGPACRLRCGLFFDELETVVASEEEYIVIKSSDGHTEFRPGPCSVIRHPVEHASVTRYPALRLSEQELIVVYRTGAVGRTPSGQGAASLSPQGRSLAGSGSGQDPSSAAHLYTPLAGASPREPGLSDRVRRELVRGPCIYIPRSASEWTHEFAWTGAANSERSIDQPNVKQIGALKFKKMRTCPGKMYVDVDSVRTKDNALLTLKLMIFFKFVNVEQMLDNTNDPFGDMINAATADVIEWCAPKKFDDFLVATDALNRMEIYQQLIGSLKKIGMEIEKVVFRGYDAPASLQRLHDSAIEKRTAMALQKEADEEQQCQADFKLRRESERAAQQSKLAMDRCHHELEIKRKTAEAEQAQKKAEYELELNRLREIKALDTNTDIGKYLIAKECEPQQIVQCATMMSAAGAAGQADSTRR